MKERIEGELRRAQAVLTSGALTDMQYCEIYAVQQALFWAVDPNIAKSPIDTVMEGKVHLPIREEVTVMPGIQAN